MSNEELSLRMATLNLQEKSVLTSICKDVKHLRLMYGYVLFNILCTLCNTKSHHKIFM